MLKIMSKLSLFEHFSVIKDHRQPWKVEHSLYDILLLTVCAVIAGADGWEQIEDFGNLRLNWLRKYGDFKQGIPAHDTIARVVSRVSPSQLQRCFINWMKSCHELTEGQVIAIDGKTVRRSFNKSKRTGAIHMVSAFSAGNSVVLGQLKTEEKSNEITAIPELLKLLEISGCLITLDALGCQTKIANEIIEQGADYLLAVKGNQGRLEQAFDKHFALENIVGWEGEKFSTESRACHGRNEQRLHIVSELFDDFVDLGLEWRGMKRVCVAVSFRSQADEVAKIEEVCVRYYICSKTISAERFAEAIREHWHVENRLHYKLDVGFYEDDCRIRRGDAAENFVRIRHGALNLLNAEKTFKGGVKRKRMRAAMSEEYLEMVLAAL